MAAEDQLKALVRQAFSLRNTADRAVLDVDALLGQVMLNVKALVEQLPEENLLKAKAWRQLEPMVKLEMEPYARGLYQAVQQENAAAAPSMAAYAEREAKYAGVNIVQGLGSPSTSSVVNLVNSARIGKARFRELFMPKAGPVTPWVESMYKVVNRNVQAGIIQGLTTEQIADGVIHETVSRGVPGVSLQGKTSVRKIRAQAMAMTRTVVQDVDRQVHEAVWDANADAMEGMVYLFTTALDSRTCETCAPLDNTRYDTLEEAPTTPLHPNCRCQVLPIDPEDPFWNDPMRNGQQISDRKYTGKGAYQSKVKVNGQPYYRKAVRMQADNFAEYIAQSNRTTQLEFFGSKRRVDWFRRQYDELNKDPQDILSSMLTRPTGSAPFIRAWKKDLASK